MNLTIAAEFCLTIKLIGVITQSQYRLMSRRPDCSVSPVMGWHRAFTF